MNKSPKILVIRLSSLGDILHTLPALAGLRASFPDAKIDWLVAGKFRFLLSAVRGINEIHCLETVPINTGSRNKYDWHQVWNTIGNLRSRHYDFSIDFQGLLKTSFIGFISGSKTRLGFSKDLLLDSRWKSSHLRIIPVPGL